MLRTPRRVEFILVLAATLGAAVGAAEVLGDFDPTFTYKSTNEDESDSGYIGDILAIASVDYQGSSTDGYVNITTTTSQSGNDVGVPSDQLGVMAAFSDASMRWVDSEGTGSHDLTFGYSWAAAGGGTSHATPVSQTYYEGSFQHAITSSSASWSGGSGPESFAGHEYREDLEDNDSFAASSSDSYSATRQASPDANGVWAVYSVNIHALTSYTGFNDPPAVSDPSHGVTADLSVYWRVDLNFDN